VLPLETRNHTSLAAAPAANTQTDLRSPANVIGIDPGAPRACDERKVLMRDFVFDVLAPIEADATAARPSLKHDYGAGARYHLKRVIECAKAAASTLRELESLNGWER
jgi:hypothetical protein